MGGWEGGRMGGLEDGRGELGKESGIVSTKKLVIMIAVLLISCNSNIEIFKCLISEAEENFL